MDRFDYDKYLDSLADKYNEICEPRAVRKEIDYNYYISYEYNCEYCDNEECEYWEIYNDK